jgi:hypothetical protein
MLHRQRPVFEKALLGPEYRGVSPFPFAKDLGVQVLQTALSWKSVAMSRPADPTNRDDPAYVWPESLEQTVAEAQANGIQMLFYVMDTPSWAPASRAHEEVARSPPGVITTNGHRGCK